MHRTIPGAAPPLPVAQPQPLRWPPPGLEALHGAIWPAITTLAVGGSVMTFPLLWSTATPQPFWGTGTFGASWWLPLLTGVAGMLLAVGAIQRIARLLLDAARAAELGYSWRVIAYAVADGGRDGGFLLQGLRHYAPLGEAERRWLLNARVGAAAAYAAAMLWVPVAFSLGVLLAGRGTIDGGGGLVTFVVAPAAALLLLGFACRTVDVASTRRHRREWRTHHDAQKALRDESVGWRTALAHRTENTPTALADVESTRFTKPSGAIRIAAWAIAVVGVLLPLPLLTLALVNTVAPVLAGIAAPRYDALLSRMAETAVLAPLALPIDPSITPAAAGEALYTLSFVGRPAPQGGGIERLPVRHYPDDWWSESPPPGALIDLGPLPVEILEGRHVLTGAEQAALEAALRHPALREFATVARAGALDLAAARWDTSRMDGVGVHSLPFPLFGQVRQGALIRMAGAAMHARQGRHAEAEAALLELVSAGLVIAREGTSVIDMLVGASIASAAGKVLVAFYESRGRTAEADALHHARRGVEVARTFAAAAPRAAELNENMHGLMTFAANASLPRGMRWEAFATIQLTAGCLNPYTAVFGHGAEYNAWREQTHRTLVRYPSEEALYRATLKGLVPELGGGGGNVVLRLVGMTLRRGANEGACAALLAGVSEFAGS
jgi:hypothetical protein